MRRSQLLVRALAFAAAVPLVARAQDDDSGRRGISLSAGLGVTSAGISCSPDCGAERKSGPTYLVRFAGHLSPQVTLGIEGTVYNASVQHPPGPGRWTLSWFLLAAQWYPNPEADFFIKAGFGLSGTKADLPFDVQGNPAQASNVNLTTSDYGGMVGVGRDFFVTERYAVTPYVSYLFSPRTQATINQANSGARISGDIIVLGIALSIP